MRRHQIDQDAVAEIATEVVIAAMLSAILGVGLLVAGLGSQLIQVYALHGKTGAPEAGNLHRALQVLVGSWIVAATFGFTTVPVLMLIGTSAAFVITLAFPFYVLTIGYRLGMPSSDTSAPSGNLDDYLGGLEAPTVIPFTGPSSASSSR